MLVVEEQVALSPSRKGRGDFKLYTILTVKSFI